jgi:exopolyphosphatase/guanosine-5'-triphosphate,3'-diphosphate pyrophosphatase
MTARYVKSDPIEAKELNAMLAHYNESSRRCIEEIKALKPVRVIGTSGALENLTAMCARGSGGEEMISSAMRLEQSSRRWWKAPPRTRHHPWSGRQAARPDLRGGGAGSGGVSRLEFNQIQLCGSALREGILVDYLARHRRSWRSASRSTIPAPAILDLGRRCHWNREHCEQVARLTVDCSICSANPRLGRDARELIEYGALLHDIGALIGAKSTTSTACT